MQQRVTVAVVLILSAIMFSLPAMADEKAPLDTAALKGVKSGKGIFDINLSGPEKLPLYLEVIKETHAGLKAQGVKPELVVAFRGTSVKLLSSARANFSAEQKEALQQSDELIRELAKLGVRFEACAVATRLFGVENSSILPGVKVVGNTFISLIGYQSKGYALIPIQ
jgi:intracellular sulfur oxidation DsrE/DsrF family protein